MNNTVVNNVINHHASDYQWKKQRAEFLGVPEHVLHTRKTFDLIKLLRKNRRERLAAEAEAQAQAGPLEASTPLTVTYKCVVKGGEGTSTSPKNGRQYYNGFRIKNAPLGSRFVGPSTPTPTATSSVSSSVSCSVSSTPRSSTDDSVEEAGVESSADASADEENEETITETITARDLIRIVPDIILCRELFQPFTLTKSVNLNCVLKLALEEWQNIDMDDKATTNVYHQTKHAELIDDSDVEEEEEEDFEDDGTDDEEW